MIAEKMKNMVANSSAIRAMFEEGNRLAQIYGAENVFDFSLGNPNVAAPEAVKKAILELLDENDPVVLHGYTNSNSGYADVRETVAQSLNERFGTKFAGKNIAFLLFLSLMMIPNELVIITNFVTISNLDLRNTFPGLILPSVTSVFYIYLLKENFEQIPDSLYYAAKVDGTGDFKYLWKVMIPISKPTIITITLLKVIECWNSYVWPRLITDDENYFLVSNGIQEIRENGFGRENIPAMMAAVVVISVPLVVLFLIFRSKIMVGVSRGGTKG